MNMGTQLNPYLTFNGNTREAMEFYHGVLGGTLDVQTFGEAPMESAPEDKDRVMHARLDADGFTLMASDSQTSQPTTSGDNISLSLQGSDRDALGTTFEGLSDGGQVVMSMEDQFWGDTFGMLTDRFGIHWMVNVTKEA
jgi:PhnB protein